MNYNNISNRLLEQMFTVPFPFHDILRQQIAHAKVKHTIFPDVFRMEFEVDPVAPRLPEYMINTEILSWEASPEGEYPYLCILFQNSKGQIDWLQVVNLAGENINWEALWSAPISICTDYAFEHILTATDNQPLNICKVWMYGKSICFYLANSTVSSLCFMNCAISTLEIESIPATVEIQLAKTGNGYSIKSKDNKVNFNCSCIWLR